MATLHQLQLGAIVSNELIVIRCSSGSLISKPLTYIFFPLCDSGLYAIASSNRNTCVPSGLIRDGRLPGESAGPRLTGSLALVSSHVFSGPGVKHPTTSTYEKSPTGGGGLALPGITWRPESPSAINSPSAGGKSVFPEHVGDDVEVHSIAQARRRASRHRRCDLRIERLQIFAGKYPREALAAKGRAICPAEIGPMAAGCTMCRTTPRLASPAPRNTRRRRRSSPSLARERLRSKRPAVRTAANIESRKHEECEFASGHLNRPAEAGHYVCV